MEYIFSCLILSLEYQFMTICLKSYILRKLAVLRKLRKTKISFHAQLSQNIFPVLRNCAKKKAKNSLRFMRKNSAKVRKKNLEKP